MPRTWSGTFPKCCRFFPVPYRSYPKISWKSLYAFSISQTDKGANTDWKQSLRRSMEVTHKENKCEMLRNMLPYFLFSVAFWWPFFHKWIPINHVYWFMHTRIPFRGWTTTKNGSNETEMQFIDENLTLTPGEWALWYHPTLWSQKTLNPEPRTQLWHSCRHDSCAYTSCNPWHIPS